MRIKAPQGTLGQPNRFGPQGAYMRAWPPQGNPASSAPFTPTDLGAGLHTWLKKGVGYYQDTARTTPAADGDPVGAWEDASGNGNHFIKESDATRPLRHDNALNFFWKIAGGTVHSKLLCSSLHASVDPRAQTGLLVIDAPNCGSAPLYDISAGGTKFGVFLGEPNGGGNASRVRLHNGAAFQTSTCKFRGKRSVIAWRSTASGIEFFADGETDATVTAVASATGTSLILGSFAGGGQTLARIHEVVQAGTVTDAQWAGLKSYGRTVAGTLGTADQVFVVADSLASGVGSETGRGWPMRVTNRLTSEWFIYAQDGGFALNTIQPVVPATLKTFFGSGEVVVVIALGVNDVLFGRSAAQIEADIWTYVDTVRSGTSAKVIVLTIPACTTDAAKETVRTTANAGLIANAASHSATICDIAGQPEFDDEGDTTYYAGDNTHWIDAGHSAAETYVQATMASV